MNGGYGITSVHPVAEKFRLLDGDELAELVESVRASGLRDAIKLDHTGTVLVDGRNRLHACQVAGVEPKFERLPEGTDLLVYIIDTNIARRHLSTGERAMLAVDLLPDIEAEAKVGRPSKGESETPADLPEFPTPARQRESREKAAALTGTSGRAVSQAKRIKNEAPDLAERVSQGEVTLDNAEKQLKRRKTQAAEAEARVAVIESTTSDAEGDGWRMFHGDFRERLLELEPGSVDLIVTDPPYPAEFLPLWSDLAQVAARLLKPQGLLVAMSGKIHLDQVMAALGDHLSYGWAYCIPIAGSSSRIMARKTLQTWKPWLVYSNGAWPAGRLDWHTDTIEPASKQKGIYRWQQPTGTAVPLIEQLSSPGALVVDPFAGTASFGVAALELDRKFIGVELDADRFAECVGRLEGK